MIYQRRASPLHATRPAVSAAWSAAVLAVAVAFQSPLVLGTLIGIVVAAAFAARVPGTPRAALRIAVVPALLFAVINPFVSHQGLTVLARLGDVAPFGEIDITLEAVVYGAVLGLTVIAIVLTTSLAASTIDPDELLRAFRRVSFHSALTAALATRLVPVLAADARRLADARRCRSDGGGHGARARLTLVHAVASGALERAVDIAAVLEVRGYGSARRPPRVRRPWSRHDAAFAAAAVVLLALVIAARLTGVAAFSSYPTVQAAVGARDIAFCVALAAIALAPFADRRGIEL